MRDIRLAGVTKLNALRRLAIKVHGESPAPKKHKEWRFRLYDGDRVVGYVGLVDIIEAEREFMVALNVTTPDRTAVQIAVKTLAAIANMSERDVAQASAMRTLAIDALAEIGKANLNDAAEEMRS